MEGSLPCTRAAVLRLSTAQTPRSLRQCPEHPRKAHARHLRVAADRGTSFPALAPCHGTETLH
eukprot:3989401-Amphidinium_carterae.1